MELSVLKSLGLVVSKNRAMVRKCTTKGLYILIGDKPLMKVDYEREKVDKISEIKQISETSLIQKDEVSGPSMQKQESHD